MLKWITITMVASAAAGTIWYVIIERQQSGSLSAVSWSILAAVWFVVLRRLLLLWRQNR
jgi:hypothetical protein